MIRALQEVGTWQVVAAAIVVVAALMLLRAWRVRRRQQRAVLREVQRLQREFAIRDALESREDRQL